MSTAADIEAYFDLVAAHQRRDPALTPLQAGILSGADLGIATDTRTFARALGIAHALVLRELAALVERDVGIRIIRRDERTMRVFYAFNSDG
ncbi:hypothetical protein [Sinorhizobium sp. BG8]|uniref:hypothetical protein n=1 Tax=Sinorhizobium sp. BG8 TaxID=2613773 RepID=UPI00193D444B|nr:hypothetical protein [Sinorhizobium sp. BG8]QRM55237.1 hypothetical protein F3Y30_12340 [Sinorhizobium sp. BG8]